MLTALCVSLSSLVAGTVQGVTGFGASIVMMLFFPYLFPVLRASALSSAITLAATVSMTWAYRRHIHRELILFPAVCYIVATTAVLQYADRLPSDVILKVFGVFLIILSVYFVCFSGRLQLKATPATAAVCAAVSGVASGLFGIGGPPMVLYYLAALPEKEDYLGTIQAFFLLTNVYTLAFRVYKGYFTVDLLPMLLLGMAVIFLGNLIGQKIINRINADLMRKVVYIFLGITGVINLL